MMSWLQPTALNTFDHDWASKVLTDAFQGVSAKGVWASVSLPGLVLAAPWGSTKAQRPKKHSFEPEDPEGQELDEGNIDFLRCKKCSLLWTTLAHRYGCQFFNVECHDLSSGWWFGIFISFQYFHTFSIYWELHHHN